MLIAVTSTSVLCVSYGCAALPSKLIYVTVSGKRVHSAQNVHSSYKRL